MEMRTDLRRMRPWGLLIPAICCMLLFVGCEKQILLLDGLGIEIKEAPATLPQTITIVSKDPKVVFKADNSGVSFFLNTNDPQLALEIDEDKAEPWLIQLVNDPPRRRAQSKSNTLKDEEKWGEGTLGEYIVPRAGTEVSADGKSITVQVPELLGLLSKARVTVKVAQLKGTADLILNPPPAIQKVTRTGDIMGSPYEGPVLYWDEELEDFAVWTLQDRMFRDIDYAVVPSQVASPVAVDGKNIDSGATYQWVLEGDNAGAAAAFVNGRLAWSPTLMTDGTHARVGIKVTNKDGQSDMLDLALLATEPPMIYTMVRSDAIGQNLPWSAQEIPANAPCNSYYDDKTSSDCFTVKICGKGFDLVNCEYVAFTELDGTEIGRYYVPKYDTDDNDSDGVDLNDGSDYTDCIVGVVTPKMPDVKAPKKIQVTAHFADGSYTYNEALLDVVPPPVIVAAAPESVPATPVDNDRNVKVTLTGDYLHKSSEVLVRWAFIPYYEDDVIGNMGVAVGPNGDEWIADTRWAEVDGGYTLTFTRPAFTNGEGSYGDPVSPASMVAKGVTDRALVREDRNVRFVVRDYYGQTSDLEENPADAQVTYAAPPQIYNFQIENDPTAATREEKFLLTGWNWNDPVITFVRQDNGRVIFDDAMPIIAVEGGVQVYTAPTPTVDMPPAGSDIPVLAYIKNADGQRVTALFSYRVPNASPLMVFNSDTGYPEVGALAADPDAPNPVGRNVTITGFKDTALLVEFLTVDGELIVNPELNDNPIVVASGDPLTVAAPILEGVTEDTPVFIRLTDVNGQVTPAQQYGVVMYKPAPTNLAVAVVDYDGVKADGQFMPATKRLARESLEVIETRFEITGDNMQSNLPYLRLNDRSWAGFKAYAGTVAPGELGFAGWITAVEGLNYEGTIADGIAFGDLPSLAVAVDQEVEVSFYDIYGQKGAVAPTITAIAPPVLDKFLGEFVNYADATERVEKLVPGRNGKAAPSFIISGVNIANIVEVRLRDGDDWWGDWMSASLEAGAPDIVRAGVYQATKEELPETTMLDAIVRAADGQVVLVEDITYTAPPQIYDVLGQKVTANSGAVQAITLVGNNLNVAGGNQKFAVDFTNADDIAADVAASAGFAGPNTFGITLDVNEVTDGDDFLTKYLGPLTFTFTNRVGQTNEAPFVEPNPDTPALVDANLFLHSFQADGEMLTLATGAFTGKDDVVVVAIGLALDEEQFADDETEVNVPTLRVELWKGAADGSLLLKDSAATKQTLLVQQSGLATAENVQYKGLGAFVSNFSMVAVGDFVGDGNLDLAVGVLDYLDDLADPTTQTGAVYLFAGDANGLAPVSATNPTILVPTDAEEDDYFGYALAAMADGLAVGAPGVDVTIEDPDAVDPDDVRTEVGAVYVYSKADIAANTPDKITVDIEYNDPVAYTGLTLGVNVVVANGADVFAAAATSRFHAVFAGMTAETWRTEIGNLTATAGDFYGDGADMLIVQSGQELDFYSAPANPAAAGEVAPDATITTAGFNWGWSSTVAVYDVNDLFASTNLGGGSIEVLSIDPVDNLLVQDVLAPGVYTVLRVADVVGDTVNDLAVGLVGTDWSFFPSEYR